MIETITFKGHTYPKFQSQGNAAKYAAEFANEVCKGIGYDIGCNRIEWALKDAIPVDVALDNNPYDAYNLPAMSVDFFHSSHVLEHLRDWVEALDYWHKRLHLGGVLFLYLPDMDTQVYWRPWHNRKHIHYLTPVIMQQYFTDMSDKWENSFVSNTDLNNSFICIAQKK